MSRAMTHEAGYDVTPCDGRFRCVTRMKTETTLPGWARRLLQSGNTITQYELWHDPWADGTRVYDIVATVTNVPVTIRGQGSVSPAGMCSCRYHLDLEVSSQAPVSGRRLEALVAAQLDRTATGELEFGARWLAQRV